MCVCSILCGPVSSSVFLEDCVACVFVLASQQLRVHSSSSSSFYIHVTSRAVIEDSQKLTFAPYSWLYPDIDAHYEVSLGRVGPGGRVQEGWFRKPGPGGWVQEVGLAWWVQQGLVYRSG